MAGEHHALRIVGALLAIVGIMTFASTFSMQTTGKGACLAGVCYAISWGVFIILFYTMWRALGLCAEPE